MNYKKKLQLDSSILNIIYFQGNIYNKYMRLMQLFSQEHPTIQMAMVLDEIQ